MDIVWCCNYIVDLIKRDLKAKSEDYMWKHFNPYEKQTQDQVNPMKRGNFDKEDIFDFEIKVDDRVIVKERFTGNDYPQRVRYSVDIRKLIPEIISYIQSVISQEKFTVEYGTIEL